ncbi:acylneuraminate cytidylyltransferase family protein [Achromobacter spanius]|jgi:CMP-N-acetylneuraminic acid synthetase|uniref:acylneuraminate cytidylyltransferase family protein n=1 Tax=Achromobacter spanius TaxID=217203 RepID=UPI002226956B|nr:acylneuraminate cytidylyltransferase family protein [Achromobacter spanius]MCW3151046.1 acylneuraminate cytidylyltransferase family protein [Achromobacter spanius]
MKTIATICARGGSIGVPRKNIRLLHGKPLIVHTIEQALACSLIDEVYVSTDDQEIADVARNAGALVPMLRPAHLATSEAGKLPVIQHMADWVHVNVGPVRRVVDLDATSPLRNAQDIVDCINLLNDEADVVITGYEAEKNPYFNMVERKPDGNIRLVKMPNQAVLGRQLAPKVYSMNASIYVWHYDSLKNGLWNGRTRLHVMPRERSIDIDSEIDFRIVELIMESAQMMQGKQND